MTSVPVSDAFCSPPKKFGAVLGVPHGAPVPAPAKAAKKAGKAAAAPQPAAGKPQVKAVPPPPALTPQLQEAIMREVQEMLAAPTGSPLPDPDFVGLFRGACVRAVGGDAAMLHLS